MNLSSRARLARGLGLGLLVLGLTGFGNLSLAQPTIGPAPGPIWPRVLGAMPTFAGTDRTVRTARGVADSPSVLFSYFNLDADCKPLNFEIELVSGAEPSDISFEDREISHQSLLEHTKRISRARDFRAECPLENHIARVAIMRALPTGSRRELVFQVKDHKATKEVTIVLVVK